MRPGLEECSRLAPVDEATLPRPVTQAEMDRALSGLDGWAALPLATRAQAASFARAAQIEERALGLTRDLSQTAHNRTLCEEKRELVNIIRANNEAAER